MCIRFCHQVKLSAPVPDEQVSGRRGKYINDPGILKEVVIKDAFLHENQM